MAEFHTGFHTDFVDELVLVEPDMLRNEAGRDALQAMMDHGFVMSMGVMKEDVPALSVAAGQPHIVEFAPRDTAERFPDEPHVARWLAKGRFPLLGHAVVGFTGKPLTASDIRALDRDDLALADYGWFGPEVNKHIAGADITTAYRVAAQGSTLARERRKGPDDTFSLGLPLGQLVTAVAIDVVGVKPDALSLETYRSNVRANVMYDRMAYREVPEAPPIECVRPTLQAPGTVVDGNVVYFDKDYKGGQRVVRDFRLNKRYDPDQSDS